MYISRGAATQSAGTFSAHTFCFHFNDTTDFMGREIQQLEWRRIRYLLRGFPHHLEARNGGHETGVIMLRILIWRSAFVHILARSLEG